MNFFLLLSIFLCFFIFFQIINGEAYIRMVAEKIEDPLERPKLKHKRLPKAFGPLHEPLMDSPPQPTTVEDQQVPKG